MGFQKFLDCARQLFVGEVTVQQSGRRLLGMACLEAAAFGINQSLLKALAAFLFRRQRGFNFTDNPAMLLFIGSAGNGAQEVAEMGLYGIGAAAGRFPAQSVGVQCRNGFLQGVGRIQQPLGLAPAGVGKHSLQQGQFAGQGRVQ